MDGTEKEYLWDFDYICNALFLKIISTKSDEEIASIIIEVGRLFSVFYYDFYYS